MQTRLMSEITTILESGNVSGAVLGQTVTNDRETEKLAEQYGITVGKAKLIKQITQQNTFYSFEALVPLTINELNLISESGGTKLENIESIGTASASAYIGEQAAMNAALDHAGVKAADAAAKAAALKHAGVSNVSEYECEPDNEHGKLVYEISFKANGYEYDYEIDAATGTILDWEKEKD